MKTMIKANLTALAVVGAIAFPGAYGNTMHIKSFVDEQHEAYHHGGTESKIDPPKTRKIKYGKKASSTGQFVPRTFPSHRAYLDWLISKGWPKFPGFFWGGEERRLSGDEGDGGEEGGERGGEERRLEDNPSQGGIIVAQFPEGVFDPTQKDSPEYINGIQSRCGEADGSKITVAGILACHIYFNPVPGISENTVMTYGLGPITLGTNLLDATRKGEYLAQTVNVLFSFNAMAMMIERGCFVFNREYLGSTSTTTSYVDSETYSSTVKNEAGISVSAKVSYGPVGVNAGYSQQNKNTWGQTSDRKVAFGSGNWEASIGTMTNQCLEDPELFPQIKDLLDPNVVKQWKSVRKDGANSTDFDAVAMGGVFIPTSYHYGVRAGYVITASYEALSSTAASDASKSITAGIKGGSGAGSASIQSKVSSAIDKSSASSSIDFKHHTEGEFINVVQGLNFTFEAVNEAATEKRKDVNQLGLPTRVQAYTTLADIVNMYFGNDAALGVSFADGLKNEFAYFKCNSGVYQYFDGFGDEINSGSGSCSPVSCRSAMHVRPNSPSAPPFVPQYPCQPGADSSTVGSICNLAQCTPEVYDPRQDWCYKQDNVPNTYCWWPTYHFPKGPWSGSNQPDPPYADCGTMCTEVCPEIDKHCN